MIAKCDVCRIGDRVERLVRYQITVDDRLIVVDNVPAVVCDNCGETTFTPETVARLQQKVWGHEAPARTIEATVYEFSN